METNIKRPLGFVQVSFMDMYGNPLNTVDIKNAVLPTAIPIIARSLGGDSSYKINTIEIYRDDMLLAASSTTPSFPDNETVKFSAIFEAASFSGTFNKCILKSSTHGDFSLLENFELEKLENNILSIGWNIKPI